MSTTTKQQRQENKSNLHKRLIRLALGLLIIALALGVATFAWYIYNTQSHTTKVHMAAGTSTMLEIAKEYDGPYSSSVDLSSFQGTLDPVSTDKVTNGFEKVYGYTNGDENKSKILANLFGPAQTSDYFKTTLFLRTNAKNQGVYVCDMNYGDDDEARLLATAIRVGLVVHEPGVIKDGETVKETPVAGEYIFEISQEKNPRADYNTEKGEDGYVLDSSKFTQQEHGCEVIKFDPYTKDNFVDYNSETGQVTLKAKSLKLFDLTGSSTGKGKPGESVQVDTYVWLEGCDSDCTRELASSVLKDFAVSFASYDNK